MGTTVDRRSSHAAAHGLLQQGSQFDANKLKLLLEKSKLSKKDEAQIAHYEKLLRSDRGLDYANELIQLSIKKFGNKASLKLAFLIIALVVNTTNNEQAQALINILAASHLPEDIYNFIDKNAEAHSTTDELIASGIRETAQLFSTQANTEKVLASSMAEQLSAELLIKLAQLAPDVFFQKATHVKKCLHEPSFFALLQHEPSFAIKFVQQQPQLAAKLSTQQLVELGGNPEIAHELVKHIEIRRALLSSDDNTDGLVKLFKLHDDITIADATIATMPVGTDSGTLSQLRLNHQHYSEQLHRLQALKDKLTRAVIKQAHVGSYETALLKCLTSIMGEHHSGLAEQHTQFIEYAKAHAGILLSPSKDILNVNAEFLTIYQDEKLEDKLNTLAAILTRYKAALVNAQSASEDITRAKASFGFHGTPIGNKINPTELEQEEARFISTLIAEPNTSACIQSLTTRLTTLRKQRDAGLTELDAFIKGDHRDALSLFLSHRELAQRRAELQDLLNFDGQYASLIKAQHIAQIIAATENNPGLYAATMTYLMTYAKEALLESKLLEKASNNNSADSASPNENTAIEILQQQEFTNYHLLNLDSQMGKAGPLRQHPEVFKALFAQPNHRLATALENQDLYKNAANIKAFFNLHYATLAQDSRALIYAAPALARRFDGDLSKSPKARKLLKPFTHHIQRDLQADLSDFAGNNLEGPDAKPALPKAQREAILAFLEKNDFYGLANLPATAKCNWLNQVMDSHQLTQAEKQRVALCLVRDHSFINYCASTHGLNISISPVLEATVWLHQEAMKNKDSIFGAGLIQAITGQREPSAYIRVMQKVASGSITVDPKFSSAYHILLIKHPRLNKLAQKVAPPNESQFTTGSLTDNPSNQAMYLARVTTLDELLNIAGAVHPLGSNIPAEVLAQEVFAHVCSGVTPEQLIRIASIRQDILKIDLLKNALATHWDHVKDLTVLLQAGEFARIKNILRDSNGSFDYDVLIQCLEKTELVDVAKAALTKLFMSYSDVNDLYLCFTNLTATDQIDIKPILINCMKQKHAETALVGLLHGLQPMTLPGKTAPEILPFELQEQVFKPLIEKRLASTTSEELTTAYLEFKDHSNYGANIKSALNKALSDEYALLDFAAKANKEPLLAQFLKENPALQETIMEKIPNEQAGVQAYQQAHYASFHAGKPARDLAADWQHVYLRNSILSVLATKTIDVDFAKEHEEIILSSSALMQQALQLNNSDGSLNNLWLKILKRDILAKESILDETTGNIIISSDILNDANLADLMKAQPKQLAAWFKNLMNLSKSFHTELADLIGSNNELKAFLNAQKVVHPVMQTVNGAQAASERSAANLLAAVGFTATERAEDVKVDPARADSLLDLLSSVRQ